jgi:tetratricopeptide (TPR) repeat protein
MKVLEKWWFWFALSFITYANTLNHDYTIDDLIVVTSNKMTQEGIGGIPELFKHSYLFGYDGREDESYRPVTLASFAVEKSFLDAKPAASHFVQVLLYGLCMIVVFKYLSRLFGEEKKDYLLEISKEFFEQQKIEKSLEIMTIYVDRFPEDLSAKSNKGMLLEMQGSKKEALKIYEEILSKDPNQVHTKELYNKLKQSI